MEKGLEEAPHVGFFFKIYFYVVECLAYMHVCESYVCLVSGGWRQKKVLGSLLSHLHSRHWFF